MSVTTVGGIRGSTKKKLRPGKKMKTRRDRRDVSIRHVDPDGKIVTFGSMKGFLRSMMIDEDRPFAELAEDSRKHGGVKSPSTFSKLFWGEVQNPSMLTQLSVMRTYGYQMRIEQSEKPLRKI